MIGTKRKAGRDTAGQAFAAEGNGHFTESRRLRQLPPAAPALALRALCLLDSSFSAGCTIQAALQQVLEDTARRQEGGLAERDRHLAAELAYGTLRMENRLAFVLGKVLRQPLKLPLPLRRLLAVAAYGLLFLDRLPAHAVLHTAVDLARQLYGPGLARVVNGSLRSVQRLGDAVRTPDFYAGPADEETFFAEDAAAARKLRGLVLPEAELRLARFHAVPRWLVALWQQAYGDEACRALLARSGARPWQALRVNASRPQAATLKQALLACVPADGPAPQAVGRWGVAFAPGQTPAAVQGEALARLLEQGALSQQAAASQEVMAALGLEDWLGRGWPVWDACAGYGGKSVQLLEQGGDVRLCTDRSFSRLRQVPGHCRRLGLALPHLALADASRPPVVRWQGGIIADVPCSGLGVLARRPDLRRRPQTALAEHADLQRAILKALAARLEPGAELAYITCTLHPLENEQAVDWLLAEDSGLERLVQWQTPHDHPWLEGMFAARLRRRG